jgi:hypothetical protein
VAVLHTNEITQQKNIIFVDGKPNICKTLQSQTHQWNHPYINDDDNDSDK